VVTVEPDQAVREVPTDREQGQTKKRAPGKEFGSQACCYFCPLERDS